MIQGDEHEQRSRMNGRRMRPLKMLPTRFPLISDGKAVRVIVRANHTFSQRHLFCPIKYEEV